MFNKLETCFFISALSLIALFTIWVIGVMIVKLYLYIPILIIIAIISIYLISYMIVSWVKNSTWYLQRQSKEYLDQRAYNTYKNCCDEISEILSYSYMGAIVSVSLANYWLDCEIEYSSRGFKTYSPNEILYGEYASDPMRLLSEGEIPIFHSKRYISGEAGIEVKIEYLDQDKKVFKGSWKLY